VLLQSPPHSLPQKLPQVYVHSCPQLPLQLLPQPDAQAALQPPLHSLPQLVEQTLEAQPVPHSLPQVDVQPPTHRALFSASSTTCRISSSCLALSFVPRLTAPPSQGKTPLPA
jgi:hypothetical protein